MASVKIERLGAKRGRKVRPLLRMNVDNFLPKDYTKVQKILDLGYPTVHDHLDEIIVWLQDMNWPGSKTIASFLVSVGEPMIPHVKQVLASKDDGWKYNVLSFLVDQWPREWVAKVESELMNFAMRLFDYDDLDIESLRLLTKYKLGDEAIIRREISNKKVTYEWRLRELRKIEDSLSTDGA